MVSPDSIIAMTSNPIYQGPAQSTAGSVSIAGDKIPLPEELLDLGGNAPTVVPLDSNPLYLVQGDGLEESYYQTLNKGNTPTIQQETYSRITAPPSSEVYSAVGMDIYSVPLEVAHSGQGEALTGYGSYI